MTEEIKIKPCPFCGGAGGVRVLNGKNGTFCVVQCLECFSQGHSYRFDEHDGNDEDIAKLLAIKAWNKRFVNRSHEKDFFDTY